MLSNVHFNKPSYAVTLAFFLSMTSAVTQASDKDIALVLLEKTGVATHLANASEAIHTDALPRYSQCFVEKKAAMVEGDKQQFKALIEKNFGSVVAVPRAIRAMNDALSIADQEAVLMFFESPTGVRIVAAELGSKDYDERTFNTLMDRHLKSSAWDDARVTLIESVYDSTRAARFISTLNGEILAASTLSGHCDTRIEALEKLQPHLETLRSESQFIEPLMRGYLVPLVATVFRNIPNSDLAAYSEFAESDLGVKFFEALLTSTASSLSEGVVDLRLALQK